MPIVEVKVAVAIDEHGQWSAVGGSDTIDEEMAAIALEAVGNRHRIFWLTASLPVPVQEDQVTVPADVSDGDVRD